MIVLDFKGVNNPNYKHGLHGSKTYWAWVSASMRCRGKRTTSKHYKDKGIIMCPSWVNNAALFIKDMGEAPVGMSLDRIDNDGPYCPFNCTWSTPETQSRNRDNIKLSIETATQILIFLRLGMTQREVACKFGTHQSMVSSIKRGSLWVGAIERANGILYD